MVQQSHVIKRQLLDLQIDDRLDAELIQNNVSKILKDKLMPIIGSYLDTLGDPDKTNRIDRWEIDLGLIYADNLQHLLETSMEEQLRMGKPALISTPTPVVATDQDLPIVRGADFELVAYFLQTGAFPWWAKKTEPAMFEKAIRDLLTQPSVSYRELFDRVAVEMVSLKRLIYTCTDDLLFLIIEKLDPPNKAAEKNYRYLYKALSAGQNERYFREKCWIALFTNASQNSRLSGGGISPVIKLFFEGFNKNEAILINEKDKNELYAELMFFYNRSVRNLAMAVENLGKAYSQQLTETLALLIAGTAANNPGNTIIATQDGDTPRAIIANIQRLLNEIRTLLKQELVKYRIAPPVLFIDLTENGQIRRQEKPVTPPDIKPDQQIGPAQLPVTADDNKSAQQTSPQNATMKTDRQLDEQAPTQDIAATVNRQLNQQIPEQNTTVTNAGQSREEEAYQAGLAQVINSFNDTDKLYIHHAGLILLWPFLSRFFSKLGLTTDNVFTDRLDQYKACLLLQYLAMGPDSQPFEPFLPLNKLLCGMDLFEPVDIQMEIMQHEFDEADHLLAAVIANAPMWKTLSVEGLRQAYLQREGILSTRDGNWLLQVKRETYDILVDRLPWSNQIVKLPWMDNLIFVEWQLS
ncbi:contractile injection system tape measure protein [Mucilaginibacter sp. cycad4]|uniref:contractile injection system tape measure protein n=1 Tax=Mucilaginibacter sp. cycad4 TaxID=3342096 RepID=UPI002AAAB2D0|nr:contractile injection system tape measure protein [Mucilaginibacter gossypii]WPV01755.1 contractile injection system tape measure protein [Mucilaginibacter gossypii]